MTKTTSRFAESVEMFKKVREQVVDQLNDDESISFSCQSRVHGIDILIERWQIILTTPNTGNHAQFLVEHYPSPAAGINLYPVAAYPDESRTILDILRDRNGPKG